MHIISPPFSSPILRDNRLVCFYFTVWLITLSIKRVFSIANFSYDFGKYFFTRRSEKIMRKILFYIMLYMKKHLIIRLDLLYVYYVSLQEASVKCRRMQLHFFFAFLSFIVATRHPQLFFYSFYSRYSSPSEYKSSSSPCSSYWPPDWAENVWLTRLPVVHPRLPLPGQPFTLFLFSVPLIAFLLAHTGCLLQYLRLNRQTMNSEHPVCACIYRFFLAVSSGIAEKPIDRLCSQLFSLARTWSN